MNAACGETKLLPRSLSSGGIDQTMFCVKWAPLVEALQERRIDAQ